MPALELSEWNKMVLEGIYNGFYSMPANSVRTFIVKYPGPYPYSETHASVYAYVAEALEKIELGKRVRVTVEEIND